MLSETYEKEWINEFNRLRQLTHLRMHYLQIIAYHSKRCSKRGRSCLYLHTRSLSRQWNWTGLSDTWHVREIMQAVETGLWLHKDQPSWQSKCYLREESEMGEAICSGPHLGVLLSQTQGQPTLASLTIRACGQTEQHRTGPPGRRADVLVQWPPHLY